MDEKEPGTGKAGGKGAPLEEPASAKALRVLVPDRNQSSGSSGWLGLQGEAGSDESGLQGSHVFRRRPQRVRSRG